MANAACYDIGVANRAGGEVGVANVARNGFGVAGSGWRMWLVMVLG